MLRRKVGQITHDQTPNPASSQAERRDRITASSMTR
jgi:hypothetical protein